MKLKDLFSKKVKEAVPAESVPSPASSANIDLDSLDECVGGQAETEGVGCYLHSTQSRVY
jgi:hypothetical protein